MWPGKSIMRNFAIALLVGASLSCVWFAVCALMAQLPVIGPVSLSLAFQPWWRHWPVGSALLCITVLWVCGVHALRCVLGIHT